RRSRAERTGAGGGHGVAGDVLGRAGGGGFAAARVPPAATGGRLLGDAALDLLVQPRGSAVGIRVRGIGAVRDRAVVRLGGHRRRRAVGEGGHRWLHACFVARTSRSFSSRVWRRLTGSSAQSGPLPTRTT